MLAQSNLGLFKSQKIMLPNYVAGLISCTSDVVSMAPVCASSSEHNRVKRQTYMHVYYSYIARLACKGIIE